MARVRLLTDREGLTPEQVEVFDRVVESRGRMIRPFEVLLHRPAVAREAAELGARIRFDSEMSDHDRELVILATASLLGCAFEWDSHLPLAEAAGVRPEVIGHLRGEDGALTEDEAALIGFVRELHPGGRVSDATFEAVRSRFGEAGVVEIAATVGYYVLLGYVMGACEAC